MNVPVLVEVCVDSVVSAAAAERGGAGRIELCSSLIEGGVTPSAGLIGATRTGVSVPLFIMIRPRAGDFYYDDEEFDVMQRDIAVAKNLGANGIVFGILDADGNVDVSFTPMPATTIEVWQWGTSPWWWSIAEFNVF
jgi:copper homeostasis protein